MGFTAPRQLAQAPINAYRSFAYANSYTLISLLIPDGINEFFYALSLTHTQPPSPFFSIMFANSKMISGFCVPFFMQEIMGELRTPVIPLSQIIKTTKGTNQSECTAQRHKLCKGPSFSLSHSPRSSFILLFWQEVGKKDTQQTDKLVAPKYQKHTSYFKHWCWGTGHICSLHQCLLNLLFWMEAQKYQVNDLPRQDFSSFLLCFSSEGETGAQRITAWCFAYLLGSKSQWSVLTIVASGREQ